ncbi:MAG: TonB-dependent receptor [Pseudohongiellaceae bacterium]
MSRKSRRFMVSGAGFKVAGLMLCPQWLIAAEQELDHGNETIEEIIVTSALHSSPENTALPVSVLAGEDLREQAAATLGDMLQEQVGVNSASFGTGVGLPVIRGQSANRVQVLQGGLGSIDASAVSPDHANGLEPALAERIEVLRGPATLLYGNGAIGGVINVIDNRIPDTPLSAVSVMLESRFDTVSDQQTDVLKLEGGRGAFAWHLDGLYRESNDVEIDGFAINPATVELDDEEALEHLLESRGYLQNSSVRSHSATAGGSWILDDGYIGMSFSRYENNYGLPPAAHGHHDEEDHDEEDHHEEDHHEEDSRHHDEELMDEVHGIRVDMKQDKLDFDGTLALGGWFSEAHGRLSVVDYQHAELEPDGSIGTVYDSEGVEGRFTFDLAPLPNREGVIGIQVSERDFSASGEEAFIAPTEIASLALFTVQSLDIDDITYEVGLRADRHSMEQSGSGCDDTSVNLSGSAATIWRFREEANVMFSVAHSQRSATVEESYSNIGPSCGALPAEDLIAHAATGRLEIGLPNADREKSSNVEFALRKHAGNITGELNLFYNEISDYLYLSDTGFFVDEVEIARYRQEDAVFHGMEAELSLPLLNNGTHEQELTLFSDYVRARFDGNSLDGHNVPRIPPLRYGFELSHSHADWLVKLRWTQVAAQSDHATNETRSGGYQLLSLYADYHIELGNRGSVLVFAKGHNLLDERIRHHTSLLKDVAPAPGRGVELGLRMEF